MNKTLRRLTRKQAETKARRSMTWIHVLIAVVAIIECILLVTFTTFSWIESNSSLVIQNGPESSQIADQTTTKKMDIADRLTGTINLNYTGTDDDFAPLIDFFSEVKYFEFAKATSSDGRTLFFPCRNNTYDEAGKYRKGDTVDYNTSFLYFDFVMSNRNPEGTVAENRDVYFDNSTGFTDIFTVTGDGLSDAQKTALTNAMRMSITTQVGSGAPSTKIYSKIAYSGSTAYSNGTGSYKSFDEVPASQSYAYDENGGAGHTNNRNTWVETKQLSRSVYHLTNNVIDSDKLFVVKKNAETKVSFRIWFDCLDPTFIEAFSIGSLDYSQYASSQAAYWKIPNASIGIKFRLKTSGNDLRSIYFDDYTLTNQTDSNNNIYHLTDENPNYSVWFYTWQPQVAATPDHPARTAGYYAIPLTRDSSDSTHTVWSANTATKSEMDYLMAAKDDNNALLYPNASGVTDANNRYQKSYFCYGNYSTKTAIYKWELPTAPLSEDFVFNAYSYQPNSSTSSTSYTWPADADGSGTTWRNCYGSNIKSGVGIWQDDDGENTMTLLKFRDMSTAVTTTSYNGGSNYQIMNAAADADNHTHYLVYANDTNDDATIANNFSAAVENKTAAMYYDSDEQVFKSYVPSGWLAVGSGVSFTYCPGGVFSKEGATLRWYYDGDDTAPTTLGGEYIYTALGYSNKYDNSNSNLGGIGYVSNFYSGSAGYLKGVGTWRDVEQIKFNTELIDSDIDPAYRYYIGITDSYSKGYYAMIPDATNMEFSAYVPSTQGATTPGISFVRLDAAKESNDDTTPGVFWYGNVRGTHSTFYPVDCDDDDATVDYTHGFWNVSVLVDGSYENLIYDTLTDGATLNGDPVATYAPVVTTGSTTTQGSVDYSARGNYGLLEFSFDNQNWHTVCDDTSDDYRCTDSGYYAKMLDRYRFVVNAENHSVVYWRWTPYKGYTVTFYGDYDSTNEVYVSKTITAADTQFSYTHYVSDASETGIYLVVTEAPST